MIGQSEPMGISPSAGNKVIRGVIKSRFVGRPLAPRRSVWQSLRDRFAASPDGRQTCGHRIPPYWIIARSDLHKCSG